MMTSQPSAVSSPKKSEPTTPPTAPHRAVLAGNVFVVAPPSEEEPSVVVGQKRPAEPSLDDDLRLALQRASERRANLFASLRAKRTPPSPDTVPVHVFHARVKRDHNTRTTTVLESVLQNSDHWTLDHYRVATGYPQFPFLARFGAALNIYVYGPGSRVLVQVEPDSPTLRRDDLRAYNALRP